MEVHDEKSISQTVDTFYFWSLRQNSQRLFYTKMTIIKVFLRRRTYDMKTLSRLSIRQYPLNDEEAISSKRRTTVVRKKERPKTPSYLKVKYVWLFYVNLLILIITEI